jgi:hypothetical protein
MTRTLDETPIILTAAAEIVESRGHHKGSYVPERLTWAEQETCPVCTVAALNIAAGGPPTLLGSKAIDAARALADHLGLDISGYNGPEHAALLHHIGRWNDHPARTVDQVINALRAAAAELVSA